MDSSKRNKRQRKKLKSDEYTQIGYQFTITQTSLSKVCEDNMIDSLYDIAEKWNCYLVCFYGGGEGMVASFHNTRKAIDCLNCYKGIRSMLESEGVEFLGKINHDVNKDLEWVDDKYR